MKPALSASGCSGAPLAEKLGIRVAHRVLLIDAPPGYAGLLAPLPAGVEFVAVADAAVDVAQLFVTQREDLARSLAALREALGHDAALWVSWPKKAAKVASTVTEDTVRELALPLGFVDVEVCAVDETWSGLKLVVRKALR